LDPAVDANRSSIIRFLPGAGLAALPLLFLAAFLLFPMTRILLMGLEPLGALGPLGAGASGQLSKIAEATDVGRLLLASAGQALLSTVLTLALGLPAAAIFGRYEFPGKAILRTMLGIPFVLPTVVVASAFIVLLGPRGPFGRLDLMHSLAAVVMAHVFYNVSIVVRIVGGFWSSLDPRLRDAARVLGAGRVASFTRVTGRLLLPSIAAAGILVFSFCFSSFGVILMLGGPRMGTLETEIYRQAVYLFNLPAAALLSIVQLLATGVVMFGYSRLQARMSVIQRLRPEPAAPRRPRGAGAWLSVLIFGALPTAALFLPLVALAAGSFVTRAGPSLSYWQALFRGTGHSVFWSSPLAAAGNSLAFAVEATLISLAMGIPAAALIARGQASRARAGRLGAAAMDILFLLPLGTSAVTLGFGFIVSFNTAPFDLRGSSILIPIAHALVALPLVIRSLLPSFRSLDPRLRQSAAVLGAGTLRVRLTVDLPILKRAFLAAAAFAFTVSLGEFGATAILTRPELATLPVLIFDSLSRPGELNQGQALALNTLLMAACAAGLAVIERTRAPGTEPA
jgi:thiamine transport system permease protein